MYDGAGKLAGVETRVFAVANTDSITPHGRDMDGDPIVSLAGPNAEPSWVLEPYRESAASREYINGGGLESDIHLT